MAPQVRPADHQFHVSLPQCSPGLNPGYGYTSCYIRLYAPSQKALESGLQKRLEQVWKVMQYFGGKTDDNLEPDLERGKFRVMKSMALDSAIPSPPDDLWEDAQFCDELDRWGFDRGNEAAG